MASGHGVSGEATGPQRSSETGELSSHPDATMRSRVLARVSASNGSGSVHDLGVLPDGLVDGFSLLLK